MTFEGLTTVAEIDQRYREEFARRGFGDRCTDEWWKLSDEHRRALEAVTVEHKPVKAETPDDPNHVRPGVLRNWAMKQGIPLARKGRVSAEIENAYRAEHELPLIEKPARVVVETSASPSEVRTWAREKGIEVGERGRMHPDVIAAYVEAHK